MLDSKNFDNDPIFLQIHLSSSLLEKVSQVAGGSHIEHLWRGSHGGGGSHARFWLGVAMAGGSQIGVAMRILVISGGVAKSCHFRGSQVGGSHACFG